MSGVCVCAWTARNCERRDATSVGERPAERRRSKPWGAGWVVVSAKSEALAPVDCLPSCS